MTSKVITARNISKTFGQVHAEGAGGETTKPDFGK
jgi:hypothetical protein